MQDVKPILAVILQRCINLYLSTRDKELQTCTAQNTTTTKKVLIRTHMSQLHFIVMYV